jgi:hypothetical protein
MLVEFTEPLCHVSAEKRRVHLSRGVQNFCPQGLNITSKVTDLDDFEKDVVRRTVL